MIIKYCLAAVIAYLLGSISTGILIASRKGTDIRKEGSKNTGASNVLRILGLKSGAMTFLGDSCKAVFAILIARWICPENTVYASAIAALFVVLGHNWPVFFGFHGGKGIACSTAVVLMTYPLFGGISIAACLIVIAITKYISLGSLTMLTLFAIFVAATQPFWPIGIWAIALAFLAFYRHRANIRRIREGTENKISLKKKK